MTPTLFGRWQIRLFLLPTVGLVITLLVGLVVHDFKTTLWALLYVLLFGMLWDMLYQFITSFRWERDWPTSFQVAAGIVEGVLIWGLILTKKLPGISQPPPPLVFWIQYGLIWLSIFVLLQGPLRIFFLSWRYQGGQWLISRASRSSEIATLPYPVQQQVGTGTPLEPRPIAGAFAGAPPAQFAGPPPAQFAGPQPLQFAGPQPVQFAGPPPAQFAGNQPAQPYVCACGFTSDRTSGNFCPQCGRPKV